MRHLLRRTPKHDFDEEPNPGPFITTAENGGEMLDDALPGDASTEANEELSGDQKKKRGWFRRDKGTTEPPDDVLPEESPEPQIEDRPGWLDHDQGPAPAQDEALAEESPPEQKKSKPGLFRRSKDTSPEQVQTLPEGPPEPQYEDKPGPLSLGKDSTTEQEPIVPEEPYEPKKAPAGWLRRFKRSLKVRVPKPNMKWNQRTVTVSVEKDIIRVVAFKGKRVTTWKTTYLSGMPSQEGVEEPISQQEYHASCLQSTLDELGIKYGGAIWKMADRIGIRRGRVVMDLSLYTTLMRHLQIPKVRVRYLEPVVVSEVLESLPFDKDEVDITWQLQKEEEGHSVFAIALPKSRVDAQVQLVKDAGLIPAAAYSKASAMALASGVSNGILVHLEDSETALVLVHMGEPKVVHQLEFGSEASDPGEADEHSGALVRAVEQVAGYFQPSDPREPVRGRSLPVILTGQTSRTNPVVQSFLSKLRRKVLTVDPPVRHPADFPLSEYATNLGLFLADWGIYPSLAAQTLEAAPALRPLNLLPKRHLPRAVPVFQAAIFIILLLLAIHPMNITTQVQEKVNEKNAIAQELRTLQRQERNHDVLLASYRENSSELEAANDQMLKLEDQIARLQTELDILLARLSTITDVAVTPGIELSGIAPLGDGISVVGTAKSHAETLQYAANLRNSPLFEDARITRLDGSGGADPTSDNTVSFQVKVSIPVEEEPEEEEETSK